jgi:hypothetical protein
MSNTRSETETSVSMGALRQTLFETLQKLKEGKLSYQDAGAVAKVANAILKSAEVQMEFERMRLNNEVPANLPDMPLTPRLKSAQ